MPGTLLRRMLERPPDLQPWLPGQTSAGLLQREAEGAGQLPEVQQESKGVCREEPEPIPGSQRVPAQGQLQLCAPGGTWQGGTAALQPSTPAQQERDPVPGSKGHPEHPKALQWGFGPLDNAHHCSSRSICAKEVMLELVTSFCAVLELRKSCSCSAPF